MTSILATHKKSQDLEFLPILLNCVRWNHQSIEKWSVRDFSMEFLRFLFVFKFLCCLNFFWKKKLLLRWWGWWWRGFWGEAKCSLYGCQQVVNRKLLKRRFLAKVKSQFENSRPLRKKIQVDMQVRNCRCCLFRKNCWPHLLMAWFPVLHGTIIAAWTQQRSRHDTGLYSKCHA